MIKSSWTAVALAVLAVLALPAVAADSAPAQTAEVKVTVVFPATIDSFDNLTVKVFLDKSLPPEPGQNPGTTIYVPIDTQVKDKVSHVKGTESNVTVTVGSKATLDPSSKYTVLARILKDQEKNVPATFNGTPSVPVLTGGAPNAVTLTVTHLFLPK